MLSFLVSELGDDFGCGAVHVASSAFRTLVVTSEQVALLSQFVHHLPNGRPCARFFNNHQGFEFVDVACCTTLSLYVCLYQRQSFGHPDPDTFSLFGFAFQIQGSNRPAASSATTSAKEFASMWWKPMLLCVITMGPHLPGEA